MHWFCLNPLQKLTFNCFVPSILTLRIPCLESPSSLAPGRNPPSWKDTRNKRTTKGIKYQQRLQALFCFTLIRRSFRRPVLHPRNLCAYSQGYCHKDLRATNKIYWGLFHKLALNQIEQNKPIPLVMYLFDAACTCWWLHCGCVQNYNKPWNPVVFVVPICFSSNLLGGSLNFWRTEWTKPSVFFGVSPQDAQRRQKGPVSKLPNAPPWHRAGGWPVVDTVSSFCMFIWVFPNIGVFPPNRPILIGVFHEINHPFWGTPIFGNTHIYIFMLHLFCDWFSTICKYGTINLAHHINLYVKH